MGYTLQPADIVYFSGISQINYNNGVDAVANENPANFMIAGSGNIAVNSYEEFITICNNDNTVGASDKFAFPAGKTASDFLGWSVTQDDAIAVGNTRSTLQLVAVWKDVPPETESNAASSSSCGAHDYYWYTVAKATPDTDGKSDYMCRKCGKFSHSMKVTGYRAFAELAVEKVNKAAAGATVVLDTRLWNSFPKSTYEAIQAKKDVAVTINYTYEKTKYTVTIPAGADVLSLVDENGYCGFLKLNEVFGGKVVE